MPPSHDDPFPSVLMREATAGDVDEVVALVEAAYRGESSRQGWTTEAELLDGQRTDAEAVSALLDEPASTVLVADAGGEAPASLVACCHLRLHPGRGSAYFGMFAVRPGLQARGLGRAVLAEAERRALSALGEATMRMTVLRQRGDLIAWYERRGYRVTGETEPFPYGNERFGRPRRDDLEFAVLEKELAPAESRARS